MHTHTHIHPYTQGVDGGQCQTIGAIASTPWAIKGAIGVISDAYPLFGYHKASYIIVVGVLGSLAFCLLASMEITSAMTAAVLLCELIMRVCICIYVHVIAI